MAGPHSCKRLCRGAAIALAAFGAAQHAAHADPASVVNALRVQGCARVPAVGSPVRRDTSLDAAARELARNTKLGDALARVGYPVRARRRFTFAARERTRRFAACSRRVTAIASTIRGCRARRAPERRRDLDRDGRAQAKRRSPRCKIQLPSHGASSSSSTRRAQRRGAAGASDLNPQRRSRCQRP